MLSSTLFRRIFIAAGMILLGIAVAVHVLSGAAVRGMARHMGAASVRAVLDDIVELVAVHHRSLSELRRYAIAARKEEIKRVTMLQIAVLEDRQMAFRQGLYESEVAAMRSALAELRTVRYGGTGYFWVADYHGNFLAHPDPAVEGKDFSEIRDVRDNLILPPMIRAARERNEGYLRYWWPRPGESEPAEKIAFYRNFPLWEWVVGTGFYVADITAEVDRRKSAMVEEMRAHLRRINGRGPGETLIFDDELNLIAGPAAMTDENPLAEINPASGRPLGRDLISAAETGSPLNYPWPTEALLGGEAQRESDRSTGTKVAWVRRFQGTEPEIDWYIAASIREGEMNAPSTAFRERMRFLLAGVCVIALLLFGLFLRNLLWPVRRLAGMATEFLRRGDIANSVYMAIRGDVGLLFAAFSGMSQRLDAVRAALLRREKEKERLVAEMNHAKEKAYHMKLLHRKAQKELDGHRQEQARLQKSEERYRAMLETIEEYFYEIDLLGNLIFFNDALHEMLGYTRDELVGMNFRDLTDAKMAEKAFRAFKRSYVTGETVKGFDWYLIRRNGSRCYIEVSASPIFDQNNEVMGFRGIARDVSDLIYLVYHDSLTGLYNRKAYFERLRETLAFANRDNNEKNIFYMDLNKFKRVNDDFGHDVGDEVLREVAQRLKIALRETDYICRLGGDEFTIILNNVAGSSPVAVAQRIYDSLSQPYEIKGHIIDFISPSIGISIYPRDASDADTLTRCADKAMYAAKRDGVGFVFYHQLMADDEDLDLDAPASFDGRQN